MHPTKRNADLRHAIEEYAARIEGPEGDRLDHNDIARDLRLMLADTEHRSPEGDPATSGTPSDIDAAIRRLADIGAAFDRRTVADVLHAHPYLARAHEHGWTDTQVRDELLLRLWSYLTGGRPDTRLTNTERIKQIQDAQRQYHEERP